MNPMSTAFIAELEQEAGTTRRVLDRVPGDKLDWQPHPKSMSLGQLTLHVASVPGDMIGIIDPDEFDVAPVDFTPAAATSLDQVMSKLDESVANAKEWIGGMSEEKIMGPWRLVHGKDEKMAAPRVGVMRGFLFNHWYHHRAQLGVYLRLLDIPVPAVYGPSADENPFEM